jgi:hypothetical protein
VLEPGPSSRAPTHDAQPHAGQFYTGTGFLVGKPTPTDPKRWFFVTVTAAHVLKGIAGESTNFVFRMKDSESQYQRIVFQVPIRRNGVPLWKEHPFADVAVMYTTLPNNAIQTIPLDALATDEDFDKFELHPGDEVKALGYPFGYEVNEFAFPVLRRASLASYPLTPAKKVKQFVVDFPAFGGNSGGPVYINSQNRTYNNSINMGSVVFKVLGIVTQQITSPDKSENIGLTYVVPAEFIREAINLLPSTPQQER